MSLLYSHLPNYRPFGQPATAKVTILAVPVNGTTVTIGGTTFTYGTDFGGRDVRKVAENLAVFINSPIGTDFTSVVRKYYAEPRGNVVVLIATEPGATGNSIGLTTSNVLFFQLSGSTFAGGVANSSPLDANSVVSVGSVTFNNSGYTQLPSAPAKQLDLYNANDSAVGMRYGVSGQTFVLPAGTGKVFHCIANASEWYVTRTEGAGALTVNFEAIR